VKWWRPTGNAPVSACLQGRCITFLPRPHKMEIGKPPWCCPRQAEFWRLCCTGWCAAYIMEIGAAAGSCAQVAAVRQDLRDGEAFWLLNHSRKESKRAGSNHAPGPCHFNKEQTPLAILRYQPTVSRWFFRCFGAHLLRSP
jgi:hypothetical protein